MTRKDIDNFLKENPHIVIKEDDDAIYCRNEYLPWYQANKDGSTRIVKDALSDMDAERLMEEQAGHDHPPNHEHGQAERERMYPHWMIAEIRQPGH